MYNPTSCLKNKTTFGNTLSLYCVSIFFSLLQIANRNKAENSFQPDDSKITHIVATPRSCPKQYKLGQISSNWEQECTQSPSGIDFARTAAYELLRAKEKIFAALRSSATTEKT